ncbi:fluoride efflux transporter CrcB [Lachnospiraceae bacterium ZAX-1]
MLEFIVVGFGGFIGCCARFGLVKLLGRIAHTFPFATLISNIFAGLLIGFIVGVEQQSSTLPQRAKLFLTTGFLGGLSTFSTFSLETVNLFNDNKILLAVGNILLNVGLSLIGVVIGLAIAKLMIQKSI